MSEAEVSEAALAVLVNAVAEAQPRHGGLAVADLSETAEAALEPADDKVWRVLEEAIERGLLYAVGHREWRVSPGSHPAASVDGGGAGD